MENYNINMEIIDELSAKLKSITEERDAYKEEVEHLFKLACRLDNENTKLKTLLSTSLIEEKTPTLDGL